MMVTKNVHEILSVGLKIHICRQDLFPSIPILCVKLNQQMNLASFTEFPSTRIVSPPSCHKPKLPTGDPLIFAWGVNEPQKYIHFYGVILLFNTLSYLAMFFIILVGDFLTHLN